ncbi:MAG TPA: hypothetical protein VFU05_07730 [Cyclobacteriaceae bacterium]|nr:hypothetical protein [Cyclobacteriaceae bacterium]
MEMHVNMTAIAVAVVANFFLGFIWYTPLWEKYRQLKWGLIPALDHWPGPWRKN